MNIAVLGAGRMGAWLARSLSPDHAVTVYDITPERTAACAPAHVIHSPAELKSVAPDLLINCVTLHETAGAFLQAIPFLPPSCILCDIASIKGDLPSFYASQARPFVSLHPMFGPTFASLADLSREHVVLITESDPRGAGFFREFFRQRQATLHETSFEGHDRMMAYSLTLPFVAALSFAGATDGRAVPGTTFRREMDVALGLLSEDDHLMIEILFNRYSPETIAHLQDQIALLSRFVSARDAGGIREFLSSVRDRIRQTKL